MKPIVFEEVAELFIEEDFKIEKIQLKSDEVLFQFVEKLETLNVEIRFVISTKDRESKINRPECYKAHEILKENGYVEYH